MEQDFWKASPEALASESAHFVALAKTGRPYTGAMVIEDVAGQHPAIMSEAQERQGLDVERSLMANSFATLKLKSAG